jgi:alpha-N-arabinofuranosidase
MSKVKNPIIPGFYPDPSIIRVEKDFYIVTSSFEYFPAIPIWHSRDLIHWHQIGHVVTSKDQNLDLKDCNASGGVQAPTIRYNNGTFYVTSTRVKNIWPGSNYNFIVTAKNIEGPWSECHFIDDAEGIDSSLFFDGEKSYFLANRERKEAKTGNDTEIWMSEIDLSTFTLTGEKHVLWAGTGGIYPEGPRLFKRNGYYYLIVAEGGTLHNHTVTIARSEHVFGPYSSSPRNPILTHKHLSREYPIQNVGHADMVELEDGSYVSVCLGSRPKGGFYDGGNIKYSFGGYYRNLGRETFIFPVEWPKDNLSPLFSPQTGKIEFEYSMPSLEEVPYKKVPFNLTSESLRLKWVTIRNENHDSIVKLDKHKLLYNLQSTIEESFFGVRQTSWYMNNRCSIDVSTLQYNDMIGLSAYIKEGNYLSIEISKNDNLNIVIKSVKDNVVKEHFRGSTTTQTLDIALNICEQEYTFTIPNLSIMETLDGRSISCDMNDSHTGVMLGFIGKSEKNSSVSILSAEFIPKY